MSEQMSFVYAAFTGHVLSVITSVAPASSPLTAQDLASPTLAVRGAHDSTDTPLTGVRFDLTPDQLNVFTGDKIDAALLGPRSYYFDSQKKQVVALSFLGKALTVTPKAAGVDVDLGSPAIADTNVLIAYAGSDPSKSEVAIGKVSIGTQTTN